MAKTQLQRRAEDAASRFPSAARKPIVIEFAGLPKAGKTTTLSQVQAFLKRCGFWVEVVVERASVCPIRDKKHSNFNIWTACTTLTQILQNTQTPPRAEDPDILILDRGIFDAVCWLSMMERLARIRPEERKITEDFLLIDDWRGRITGVIVMTAAPADALEREKGYLPVEGAKGSIMNIEVLKQMGVTIDSTVDRLKDKFDIFKLDTSSQELNNNARKTCEAVANKIVNWIKDQLQEDVLSLPKAAVTKIFGSTQCIGRAEAESLVAAFGKNGDFRPRDKVEADNARIQALPAVVVRNRSGHILRLRRREQAEDHPLNKKIVIWAGGHVRREDGDGDNSLIGCAIRELQEELRICAVPPQLHLLGAVYVDSGKSTSRHAAIVYEWRAQTDDVEVALSSAEFFERRGTSLSGKFIPVDALAKEIKKGAALEPWSDEIMRKLVGRDLDFARRLFD